MPLRRRIVLGLLVAGAAILIGAAFFLYEPIVHELRYAALLRDIRRRDAVREAEAAWNRGDQRFMGTYGLGMSFPGVPDDADLRQQHGVNPIKGTTDYLVGDTQAEFQCAATEFASRYNHEILARIEHTPTRKAGSSEGH
jgi:hypothetical protein